MGDGTTPAPGKNQIIQGNQGECYSEGQGSKMVDRFLHNSHKTPPATGIASQMCGKPGRPERLASARPQLWGRQEKEGDGTSFS